MNAARNIFENYRRKRSALGRLFCKVACAGSALALIGCASAPLQIPKEVKVEVPVACIAAADRPERPTLLSDAELLALDDYRRTWALWGDRLERQGYESKLEAVAEGCSRIPAVTP